MPAFPHLFAPGRIGSLQLANRIIKAPQAPNVDHADGTISERSVRHYRRIARGGVGLVTVAFAYVDDDGARAIHGQPSASRDECLPGLMHLADVIRGEGARATLQLAHCGLQRYIGTPPPIRAPSAVFVPGFHGQDDVVEALTEEQIARIVRAFGEAALRAQRASFDAVELHAAHGYLFTNFLSPVTNLREDRYGRDAEGRSRFLFEVVEEVRRRVAPEFPLVVRISGTDYEPGGIDIDETAAVCRGLEQRGVDAVHVSGGTMTTIEDQISPALVPRARQAWASERIKAAVSIPVILSGSLTLPALAEQMLADGVADFVSLGRPLLADPDWPRKARMGRVSEIRPCIRGNDGCKHRSPIGFRCTMNPVLGHEGELELEPAGEPRRVAVAGGGPAGIEVARALALRGHAVTLFERGALGGRLNAACVPDFKDDLRPYLAYLIAEVARTGVTLVEAEATVERLASGDFDAVVVATGARPRPLDVPGASHATVLDVLDPAALAAPRHDETVVVVGGGITGVDAALMLGEQGAAVTLVEAGATLLADEPVTDQTTYADRLSRAGVVALIGTAVVERSTSGVTLADGRGLRADRVISAVGAVADDSVAAALRDAGTVELHVIGDAARPARIHDAVHSAFIVGRTL